MLTDMVLPLECGGCGAPSTRWCDACAQTIRTRAGEPTLVTPRLDPGVPVLTLGRYAGPRRQAILAVKEHGRTDLVGPLGDALGAGLTTLLTWGVVATPLVVVPAPTRAMAARRRGGDPVARIARVAAALAPPGVTVVDALRMRALTKDSVGLSASARQRNVTGRIRLRRSAAGSLVGSVVDDVIVVDDVVTTGATASESVRVLQTAGACVAAVLTVANA